MLSRHERRQLREIEHWFEETDPGLVAYVRRAPVRSTADWQTRMLSATATLGGVFLLGGIVLNLPSLIFLGICLGAGGLSCRYYWKVGTPPRAHPDHD
ncbi:DUF3040 domain-containing protein [Saccharopolyspora mangrovi]|uniref:DUF3040 domain-containing protein n=1 Tax=Saccharopolyspora mangrovi TaxID=3082379 RepID=A0ABU6A5B9_9PSEU|nr:DUF3040 domain-containing protein [Saccharopolyspora sp. S2-29]MEB3366554.1 DUF3040 domain-containing protein [Saccharopolyspora sp. S2-29]